MKKALSLAMGVVVVLGLVLAGGCDENGTDDTPNVGAATSMRFSVEWTNGHSEQWTYTAKDIGTEDFKLRWEGTSNGDEDGLIMNSELRRLWFLEDGQWVEEDVPDGFWELFTETYRIAFEAYMTALEDWTDGDWSYTDPGTGGQVRIYDIEIDPDLSDTLFEG